MGIYAIKTILLFYDNLEVGASDFPLLEVAIFLVCNSDCSWLKSFFEHIATLLRYFERVLTP